MSKISNDDLTQSGTGCFMAVPCSNSGRPRVKRPHIHTVLYINKRLIEQLITDSAETHCTISRI